MGSRETLSNMEATKASHAISNVYFHRQKRQSPISFFEKSSNAKGNAPVSSSVNSRLFVSLSADCVALESSETEEDGKKLQ